MDKVDFAHTQYGVALCMRYDRKESLVKGLIKYHILGIKQIRKGRIALTAFGS